MTLGSGGITGTIRTVEGFKHPVRNASIRIGKTLFTEDLPLNDNPDPVFVTVDIMQRGGGLPVKLLYAGTDLGLDLSIEGTLEHLAAGLKGLGLPLGSIETILIHFPECKKDEGDKPNLHAVETEET